MAQNVAPVYTGSSVGTGQKGEPRGVGMVILLSIVTLGIYGIYWMYKTTEEMKRYSGKGLGGWPTLLLSLLYIPAIVFIFTIPARVGNLYTDAGRPAPISGMSGFWILIPGVGGIIWVYKVQSSLNQFWTSV